MYLHRVIAQRVESALAGANFDRQVIHFLRGHRKFLFELDGPLRLPGDGPLASVELALPVAEGSLPSREGRREARRQVDPHRREHGSNRSPLLSPREAPPQEDEPEAADSEWRENVFPLVEREKVPHPAKGDRSAKVVVFQRDAAPSLFLPGGIRFHAIPSRRPLVRPLEPGRTSDRGAGIDRNLARGDAGPPAAEPLADPRGSGGCPPRPGARARRSRAGRLQEGAAGRPTRRGTGDGHGENG